MEELMIEDLHDEFINHQIVEKDITRNTKANYTSDIRIFLSFLSKQGVRPIVSEMNKNLLKIYNQQY